MWKNSALDLASGEGADDNSNAPEFAPLLLSDPAGIHLHRVRFYAPPSRVRFDEKAAGLDRRAKIFMKINGAASTDLKKYRLILIEKKSSYEYAPNPANAEKPRIISTSGRSKTRKTEVFSPVIT